MHLSGGGAGFTAGMSNSRITQNPEGVSIVQAKKNVVKRHFALKRQRINARSKENIVINSHIGYQRSVKKLKVIPCEEALATVAAIRTSSSNLYFLQRSALFICVSVITQYDEQGSSFMECLWEAHIFY